MLLQAPTLLGLVEQAAHTTAPKDLEPVVPRHDYYRVTLVTHYEVHYRLRLLRRRL